MAHACRELGELEQYLAGELDAGASRAVGAHLSSCAECRALLDEVAENLRLLKRLRPYLGEEREAPGPAPPGEFGPFRILRELGRGGMGVVYLAEQRFPRRQVALKIVRSEPVSRKALRRFKYEANILAQLRHPGIAPIYEAGVVEVTGVGGTSERRPYLALEYVDGEPLDAYADRHRLGVRERLELLVRVAEAVHHAHLKGVVHRDLKPGNILVEEARPASDQPEGPAPPVLGQPRVLDFGVARLVGAGDEVSRFTEAGALVGTLPFMSPEQVGSDPAALDARSDVYSLGVVAYVLLAGRLPYSLPRPVAEAARVILEVEPARLGAIDPELRGDVEAIVSKALEKDPERRYQSASELAADIWRYLQQEPVLARPPSAAYQLSKFVRRHRLAVAGAAAAFVLLSGALAVTLHLLVRARAAEEGARAAGARAVQAAAEAETAAALAERKQREAEREARDATAARDFLQEVLMLADPGETGGSRPSLEGVIEEAARRVDKDLAAHANVRAGIHHTLGQVFRRLSRLEKAELHLEKALELYEGLHGPQHHLVGYVLANLTQLRYEQGRFEEAEAAARRVLAMREHMPGKFLREVALALMNLGASYYGRGRFAEAEEAMRQSLELNRRYEGGEGVECAINLMNLAVMVARQGRHAEAEDLFRRAVRLMVELMGERSPHLGKCRMHFAALLLEMERYRDAEAESRLALDILRQAYGDRDSWLASACRGLGQVLCATGRREEGMEHLRRALAVHRQVHPGDHPLVVHDLEVLAEELLESGGEAEAERLLREGIAMGERLLGPQHPLTLKGKRLLGSLLAASGRPQEAVKHLGEFLELAPAGAHWAKPHLAAARAAYARCQRELGHGERP